jgi:hypothetical protein
LPPAAKYFYTEGFEFYDQSFKYLCKQKLTIPSEVNFTTGQLKQNQSYWIRLNAINYNGDANIDATVKNNVLSVNTKNLDSYSIDLKQLPFRKDKKLKVIENGKEIYNAYATNANLTFNKQAGIKTGLSKSHDVEGPLAHVFTKRFMLVTGTLGNQNEDKRLNSLADSMSSLWIERYQTPCIRKKDSEINREDILNSNLVLLGNASSNSFIKRIIKEIPLEIKPDYIKIGNKKTSGNNLGFYMVYPNPLNKRKYIAIIGYNDSKYTSIGFEQFNGRSFPDISNYGWFDYKIWKVYEEEDPVQGYFNSGWKALGI